MKHTWACLVMVVLGTSCGYHRKNENYSATALVTPRFSSINARVIQPKCISCHGSGEAEDDANFSNYAGVMGQVRAGNASRSKFYTTVESGEMPIGRPMLNDDELLAIYQWIQNGAAND